MNRFANSLAPHEESTADFHPEVSESQPIDESIENSGATNYNQDIAVEESIHLVTKPRRLARQDKDKLSLIAAQNNASQSMNFAQMNHF